MSNNQIENEAAMPPYSREASANHRLLLVLFALLLLVCVPVLTSYQIGQSHRRLRHAIVSERTHHIHTPLAARDAAIGGTTNRAGASVSAISRTLDALDQQVESVETKIEDLCTAQFWLALTLGALGLLAFNHTRHTLRAMRANVTALESLFETASHVSVNTAPEAMHGYLASRVAAVLTSKQALLWSYDETARRLVPLPPGYGFTSQSLQNVSVPVSPGGWADDLLFHNHVIRRPIPSASEATKLSVLATVPDGKQSYHNIGEASGEENPAFAPNDAFIETLRQLGAKDMLAVPLRAHGKPVGILCAANKRAGAAFSDDDTRLLQTFAGQAAFVLNSAELYARTLARSEQLAILSNITADVNRSLELQETLTAFWRELARLVPFHRALLALVPAERDTEGWVATEHTRGQSVSGESASPEETELTRRIRGREAYAPHYALPATQIISEQNGEDANILPSNSYLEIWRADASGQMIGPVLESASQNQYATRALQQREPLLLSWNDEADAPPQANRAAATREQTRPNSGFILVTPILAHGLTLGVLQLESEDPQAFGETQMSLLSQVAGTMAAAIRNARLYHESTHRAEQLEWAMQETQHRIKNNLQVVSSILDIYQMEAEELSPATKGLRHALRQVRAISAVNDLLEKDVRVGRVAAPALLERLLPVLTSDPSARGRQARVTMEAGETLLPGKIASALALTVSEFFINAVQHGGQGRDEVKIAVRFERMPDTLRLVVTDDGPGFPPDMVDRQDQHVGLSLARMLIERDHGGQLIFSNDAAGGGASAVATIPFTSAPGTERETTGMATAPLAADPQSAEQSDLRGRPP